MSKIEVVEVGPRDGFQSVKCAPPIATELKLDVIDQLVSAGVKHMEYTSFVSPKAIPQLADSKAVTEAVLKNTRDWICLPWCPTCAVLRTPTSWAYARSAMLCP